VIWVRFAYFRSEARETLSFIFSLRIQQLHSIIVAIFAMTDKETMLWGTFSVLESAESFRNALTSGSDLEAISALSGVAIVTLIPLTLIRNAYCFSVGYAASVATMTIGIMFAFDVSVAAAKIHSPQEYLVQAAFWYGLRLSSFLALREVTVVRMRKQTEGLQKYPPARMMLLATVMGIVYAFMVSPVLFAMRGTNQEDSSGRDENKLKTAVVWIGVALAYIGLILEAVADLHKFLTKRRNGIVYGEKRFVGPVSGLYTLCRHPNYLFEATFWSRLWLTGAASFGRNNVLAWVCGTLGWIALLSVIVQSAEHLDKKQELRYGAQPEFERWKKKVRGSLIPMVPCKD
jgi:steroid 5-alpha reductase family enzyme